MKSANNYLATFGRFEHMLNATDKGKAEAKAQSFFIAITGLPLKDISGNISIELLED